MDAAPRSLPRPPPCGSEAAGTAWQGAAASLPSALAGWWAYLYALTDAQAPAGKTLVCPGPQ